VRSGQICPLRQAQVIGRYLLGALFAGALLAGGGVCGAAPVVMPGLLLARGVTSRMPGGAAGGDDCVVFCAVEAGGDVPAWLTDELFRP
jgi:hypothetical protein